MHNPAWSMLPRQHFALSPGISIPCHSRRPRSTPAPQLHSDYLAASSSGSLAHPIAHVSQLDALISSCLICIWWYADSAFAEQEALGSVAENALALPRCRHLSLSLILIATAILPQFPCWTVDSMQLSAESRDWYAFRVRPRHEKLVSTSLRSKGHEEFLPLARALHKWADRTKTIDLPLFPGYIFCEAERCLIGRIRSTPGIIDVVRAGSTPAPASREEIETLRQAALKFLPMESCPLIETTVGRWLHIASGPLSGLSGLLVEVRGRQRLILSVDLLRRSVLVELPMDAVDLWPLPPATPDSSCRGNYLP